MSFVHGVEVINQDAAIRPVVPTDSSVIGIVGFASQGPIQQLVQCRNKSDIAQFGAISDGFGIALALDAIYKQTPGATVYVVNALAAADTDDVTDESKVIAKGKATTAFIPIGTTFTLKNAAGSVTFTKGTHYTVDAYGRIKVLDFTTIAEGSTVLATYKKKVLDTDIDDRVIGEVTAAGVRTGMYLLDTAKQVYGKAPKIFLCPDLDEDDDVQLELLAAAERMDGVCILSLALGTDLDDALASRGAAGTAGPVVKGDSERAIVTYPGVKAPDGLSVSLTQKFAPFLAGVMAASDQARPGGYAYSPSNQTIKGITGTERTITWDESGVGTDANALNEVGIVTIANQPGKLPTVWGNRSTAWPTSTLSTTFISVARTRSVINDSYKRAVVPYVDKPINAAWVDSIKQTVNSFLRGQVQIGAILDGRCDFLPEDNPSDQIALGQAKFRVTFQPPTPGERITFLSYIDPTMASAIFG